MFIVNLLKSFILPPGGLVLLFFLGLILLGKYHKTGRICISVAIVSLILFSMPIFSRFLVGQYEAHPVLSKAQIMQSDAQAIVVLGGGTRFGAFEFGKQATVPAGVLERLRYAVYLQRLTQKPILLTGGKVLDAELPSEATLMAEVLQLDYNLMADYLEHESHNTAENAQYSYRILAQKKINSILLVTHALHMHRAVVQFERVGFTVTPAPTVFLSNARVIVTQDFIPTIQALQISQMVLHEFFGMLWYSIRYD